MNGLQISIATTTTLHVIAPIACFVGAVGTIVPHTAECLGVITIHPTTVTITWACGWRFRLRSLNKSISFNCKLKLNQNEIKENKKEERAELSDFYLIKSRLKILPHINNSNPIINNTIPRIKDINPRSGFPTC